MPNKHRKKHPLSYFDPGLSESISRMFYEFAKVYFRAEVHGLHRLPNRNFLGVGNHGGSHMVIDSMIWGARYHMLRRRDPMLTLAHEVLIRTLPPRLIHSVGIVKAEYDTAYHALADGYSVTVYPGGDVDASKSFFDRHKVVFDGHKGYVRLALRTGAPIVPIVSIGGHETMFVLWDGNPLAEMLGLHQRFRMKVLPVSWSLPWGLQIGNLRPYLPLPAKIELHVLAPIHLDQYTAADADDDRVVTQIDRMVRTRMQRELDRLSKGRIPILGYRP